MSPGAAAGLRPRPLPSPLTLPYFSNSGDSAPLNFFLATSLNCDMPFNRSEIVEIYFISKNFSQVRECHFRPKFPYSIFDEKKDLF